MTCQDVHVRAEIHRIARVAEQGHELQFSDGFNRLQHGTDKTLAPSAYLVVAIVSAIRCKTVFARAHSIRGTGAGAADSRRDSGAGSVASLRRRHDTSAQHR